MDFRGRGKNLNKPKNPKTVCPDCNLRIKSVMAKRCIGCHIQYVNQFHPKNKDVREKLRKRLKEIIQEKKYDKPEFIGDREKL